MGRNLNHPGLLKEFGGTRALVLATSGDGGGGDGGSGPSSSRGNPLHRKDPWYGAEASALSTTGGLRIRAGGGGGKPEPSDDGDGSDSRRGLPEDVLRNFRNKMNRVNNDADSQGGDRPSGRGARRRGHGGDGGGDDGDDPDNPPSSSTSQAGDRYGPKRWQAT
eukprot:3705562-Amphidinium_carterae.2